MALLKELLMKKWIVLLCYILFCTIETISATVLLFDGLGVDRLLPGTVYEGTYPRDPNNSSLDDTYGSRIGDTNNISVTWKWNNDLPGEFQDHWLVYNTYAFFTPNEEYGDAGGSGVSGTRPEPILFTADTGYAVRLNSIDLATTVASGRIKVFAKVDDASSLLLYDSGILNSTNFFTVDLSGVNIGRSISLGFEFYTSAGLQSNTALIDNVSFSQVNTIPEPMTFFFVGISFFYILSIYRRRNL